MYPSEALKVQVIFLSQIIGVFAVANILFRVYVKALCIALVSDGWNDRPTVFAMVDSVPINTCEEWVFFDTARTALDVTKTFGPVNGAEGADDVFGVVADRRVLGEDYGLLDDS